MSPPDTSRGPRVLCHGARRSLESSALLLIVYSILGELLIIVIIYYGDYV